MMTRLSVIIPGYNTPEQWWRRCLNSVGTACGEDDEIICVDDGSKVKPGFLAEIAKQDTRIKPIFLEKNVGQSAARNIALERAKGEWIAFVDSDDEVAPEVYTQCFKQIAGQECDVALFGARVIWTDEKLFKDDIPEAKAARPLGAEEIKKLFEGCLFEYSWNRIYKKEFLDRNQIRFDVGICPGEDTIFALKCVLADARIAQIPVAGYVYYRTYGTSLARYQARYDESLRLRNELWWQVKAKLGVDAATGPKLGELTDAELAYWSVQNAWRYDTPLSLAARWRWLKDNRHLLPLPPSLMAIKQVVAYYVRKYLYIRPIRRWKIKRMFPNAKEMQ